MRKCNTKYANKLLSAVLMHVYKDCKQNTITKKRKRNASAVGFKCNQCDSALSLLFCKQFSEETRAKKSKT